MQYDERKGFDTRARCHAETLEWLSCGFAERTRKNPDKSADLISMI